MPRACFLAILRLMAALVGSGTLTTADNGRAVLSVALMAFFGETPEVSHPLECRMLRIIQVVYVLLIVLLLRSTR